MSPRPQLPKDEADMTGSTENNAELRARLTPEEYARLKRGESPPRSPHAGRTHDPSPPAPPPA